jgi:hypothetical protein
VLVLFAGGIVTLFLIAALAFDIGSMFLERRDQQNAADAAALAGARYVIGAGDYSGSCAGAAANAAAKAACDMALANDYDNAASDENVYVRIPPVDGQYRGFPGFVEVQIDASRSSIFGGVIGRAVWPVGVKAVAANQQGITYSFGMLALSPDACKAILISGTGTVNSAANVQSNSDGALCGGSNIGFSRTGAGVLNVTAPDATCRSVGDIQDQGAGSLNCSPATYSFALPDPLRNLPAPDKPLLAPAMKEWVAGSLVDPDPATVPKYCPGAADPNAPSEATPSTCVFGQGAAQAGRDWVLYPGLYPGGINAKGGVTLYLTPGIYWIGGGGFATSNDASVISVDPDGITPTTCIDDDGDPTTRVICDGILIYNSQLPNSPPGPITLGGGGAILSLKPYEYPLDDATIPLVIFQDRTVALAGDDITLNGSSSVASEVRGIVYAPQGDVKVNGSSSVFTMDQVIALTFKINGNGGTVNVLREAGVDAEISGVGLVE